MQRKRHTGFTIIELMLVVALLADLALIAMPSFIRARKVAQNARFVSDLRVANTAFEMYAAENNRYPMNSAPGMVPSGMSVYLQGLDWGAVNTLGSRWHWDNDRNGVSAGIAVVLPTEDDLRMAEIDTRIDNGILITGGFRKISGSRYAYLLE
jgi:prepilin-type N-terminal cleavage/methylation domain-containing protein